MPKYRALTEFVHDDRDVEPGETVETFDAHGGVLISLGFVEAIEGAGSEDPDRLARIVAAIGELEEGNPDHWTNSGKPECRALEAATGLDRVSAAERNAAWQEHLAAKEDGS